MPDKNEKSGIPESERLSPAGAGENPGAPAGNQRIDLYIRVLTVAVIAIALGLALYMLGTYVIAPTYHYNAGIKAMEQNKYDDAMEEFTAAGNYKDASEKLAESRQFYANFLAGKADAVSFVSAAVPWLSFKDGALVFANDKFEKAQIAAGNAVTIPDVFDGQLVTTLSEKMFLNADTMVSVILPDSVTVIPDGCFYNCSSLTDLTLGRCVTAVGQRAFLNCTALESLVLPETVSRIGLRAFNNCYALESAVIAGPVEALMPYTFSECVSLKEIMLPSTLTSVGEGAFTDCASLTTVHFGGTEEEWNSIVFAEGNEALTGAEIIFG